jgi:hypothetical protein
MFFRFLLTVLLGYAGYRLLKNMWSKESDKSQVQGRPKEKSMDLNKADVEDAKFEDIEDDS